MASHEADLMAQSQTVLINTLAILFVSLSTVAVLLRLYTRSRILGIFGTDDITITIAQILAIAVSVTTVLEAVWGLGRHTKFVSSEDAIKQLKCLYANTLLYNASQILTKITFLILYRRLFPGKTIQRVCFWFLIFIVGWGLAQEFIVGFSCTPLTSFAPGMRGKCLYALPVWYLTSSMNIVTDFMIFLIPVVPVLRLQMGSRQKGMLLGLFCLGFFTCIISLVRLTTLHRGVHTQDPFWDNAPAAYWSVVELNCGIMCACLLTLRPLIQKVVPHLLSTQSSIAKTTTTLTHKLSTLHHKKPSEQDMEQGIYVKKEVEMHSTTELRSSLEYPHSIADSTCQTTSITAENSQPARKSEDAAGGVERPHFVISV